MEPLEGQLRKADEGRPFLSCSSERLQPPRDVGLFLSVGVLLDECDTNEGLLKHCYLRQERDGTRTSVWDACNTTPADYEPKMTGATPFARTRSLNFARSVSMTCFA